MFDTLQKCEYDVLKGERYDDIETKLRASRNLETTGFYFEQYGTHGIAIHYVNVETFCCEFSIFFLIFSIIYRR